MVGTPKSSPNTYNKKAGLKPAFLLHYNVSLHSKGSYVVRNDVRSDIVQISNKNDLGWTAPWEMKNDC